MVMDLLEAQDCFCQKILARRWAGAPHDSDMHECSLHGGGLLTLSFPYDNPRNALRRPDFPELARLPGDIKYLWLERNPVDCVMSALCRGFATNWYEQCRIVEDNLIYIEKYSKLMPMAHTFTVMYEWFIEQPKKACERLSQFLEMPTVAERHPKIMRRPHTPDLETRRKVAKFFQERGMK